MASPSEKSLNALLSATLRLEQMAARSEVREKEAETRQLNQATIIVGIGTNILAIKESLGRVETKLDTMIGLLSNVEGALASKEDPGGPSGKLELSSKGLFGLVMSALLFKLVGEKSGKEFTNFIGDYVMAWQNVWENIDAFERAGPAFWSASVNLTKSAVILALGIPLFMLVKPFLPEIKAIAELLAEINKIQGSEENLENSKRAKQSIMVQVAAMAIVGIALVGLGFLVMAFPMQIAIGVAMILGLALVFTLVGLVAPQVEKGANAVMGMGVAIAIFSVGFLVAALSFLAVQAMFPGGMLGLIGAMVGSIVGLGLAFALAGMAAVYIIPGSVAVAFMGLAILPLALGVLAYAAVIKVHKIGIKEIATMFGIIAALGTAYALVGAAALFILPGVLMVAGMGLGLWALTWGMEKYVSSKAFDKFNAKQFQKLMKDLAGGFEYLGQGTTGGTSALKLITGIDLGKTPIERGISASAGIGRALSSIAAGVGAWADLQNIPKIKGYDKNGNPIFDSGQTADVDKAIKNVVTVFTGDGNIKKSILYPFIYVSQHANLEKGKSLLSLVVGADFGKSPFARGIAAAAGIGPVLTRIAEGMGSWVDLSNIPVIVGYDEKGNPKYGSESIDLMKVVANVHKVLDPKDKKYSVTSPFIEFSNMSGNQKGGSLLSLITGADFGKTPFQRGIASVGEIGKVLGVLAKGFNSWADISNILVITGYDNKTGKPLYDGTRVNTMQVNKNINEVITSLADTFTKLAGPTEAAGGLGGWLGFTKNAGATTIGRMVRAMEPVGDLLSSLAEGFRTWADVSNLKVVEEIKWDPKARVNRTIYSKDSINIKDITKNITYVLTEIGDTLVKLGGPAEKSGGIGGWFGMTKNPKATTMTRAARAMAPVGDMLSALAEGFMTWVDISNLKIVEEIKWDEKAQKNITIYSKESVDIKKITDNITYALTQVGDTLVALGGPAEKSGGIGGWFGMTKNPKATTLTRAARAMAPVGDMLSGLAEGFKTFAEIKNIKIIDTYVWDEKAQKNRPVYSKESVDIDAITDNITYALTSVGETLVSLGGNPQPSGGLMGWLGMTKNPRATTMMRAANAMAPVGDMLSGLATGFKTFAEIKNIKIIETYRWDEKAQKNIPVYSKESVNIDQISENVKIALTKVGEALIEVGGNPEPSGGVMGWLGMTKNPKATTMKRAANAMAPVGDLLGGLAEGFKTFAEISNIKIIDSYRWDEKAQKNIPIYSKESVDISKIAGNVKLALTTVGDALVEVGGDPEPVGGVWGWLSGATKNSRATTINRAAKAMAPMGDLLSGLAEGFKTFAEIENIKIIDTYVWDEKAQKNRPVYGTESVSISKIAGNVKLAITTVADALAEVAGEPQQESSGLFGWNKYTVYPRAKAISRAASALAPMGEMLSGFAQGMETFANIQNILQITGYKMVNGVQTPEYGKPVDITKIAANVATAVNSIADALVSVAGKPETSTQSSGFLGLNKKTVTTYPRAAAIRRAGEALMPMSEMLVNFAEGMKAFSNIDNIPIADSYVWNDKAGRMIPQYTSNTRVNIGTIGKNIGKAIGSIADVLSDFNWYENMKMRDTLNSISELPGFLQEFADGMRPWANVGSMKPIVEWRTDPILKRRVPVYGTKAVSIDAIIGNITYTLESLLGTLGKYTSSELKRIEGAMDLTDSLSDVLGSLLDGIMQWSNFDRMKRIKGYETKKQWSWFGLSKTIKVPVYDKETVSGKKVVQNIKYTLDNTLGVLSKMGPGASGIGAAGIKTGVFAFEHMSKYLIKLGFIATPFERFTKAFSHFAQDMGIFAQNFKIMDVNAINAFGIWTDKLNTLVEVGNKAKKSAVESFFDVASDTINSGFGAGEKLNKNDVTVEKDDTKKKEIVDEANEGASPESKAIAQLSGAISQLQSEIAGLKAALGGTVSVEVGNWPRTGSGNFG